MLLILEALNLMKNIKGTACIPPEPTSYPLTHRLPIEELEALEKQEKCLDDYRAHEGLAKAHIFNAIVDSLLLKIQMLTTAKEVWDMVCREYKQKPSMVQVNLRRYLHATKCLQTNEVYSHLDLMVSTREKLAGMGMNIQDEEFIQILLASLHDKGPDSYSNFLSTITASIGLSPKKLMADEVIILIKNETDHHTIETNNSNQPINEALTTST